MAIAFLSISVSVQEVIFWEFEDDGEEDEEFRDDGVVDEFPEFLDLWPVLEDEIWVGSTVGRDKFGDVVDFCVVEVARDDLTDASRFVAIVAAVLEVGSILQLLLC